MRPHNYAETKTPVLDSRTPRLCSARSALFGSWFEGESVRQIQARLEEAGIEIETPVDASAADSGPA